MRRIGLLVALCAVASSGAGACSNGVQAGTGADAYMQLPGARFVRGPMPKGSAEGPAVAQIALVNNNIWAGLGDDPITGALGPTATAAAIGLQGDLGYWLVLAGVPNVATPNDPSFSATAAFSPGIVLGSYTLVVRAVDSAGDFGLPSEQILVAETSPTNPPATGYLVVTLTWDTESNLDLHVVDPNGAEIDWNNQSSEPPFSFAQVDGGSYGYVDYDSNANCLIDGLRREDAIWPREPPRGQYTVRVDAGSLCGQLIAHWTVRALLHGNEIARASGVALDADTMGSHGTGAGVRALQFSVP
jgi:hypothetical protein